MPLKRLGKLNLSFLCLTILIWSCGNDSEVSGEATDIIYKVGAFGATRYEVDQDFKNFTKANHQVNERLLESWRDVIRTKALFLADAYAKRYDTLSIIQKKLDFALKYKIAQEGGSLWKRNVAPKLTVSNSEVEDTFKKREYVLYADLLFFSDERLLQDLGKRFSGDATKFHELVKEFRGRAGVEFASLPLVYPFTQLASVNDEIYQMKVGDVLGPVSEPEGAYLILLTRKHKREPIPLKSDRQSIEQDLLSLKRKLAIDSKQDSIYRTSKVEFHSHNIEVLAHRLKDKSANSAVKDTSLLMRYHMNGVRYSFRAQDYDEFIKYTPMLVGDVSAYQQIRDNLKDHLIRTYLYEEAKRLGILIDKTFLLEQQQYYHALLEQHYYTEEFDRKIEISEQALIDYYNENQKAFPADQIAWVTFIEFTNEHTAYNGFSYLQSTLANRSTPKLSDTTAVEGLVNIQGPERIDGTNMTWGEQNRKQFIDAQVNVPFGPIRHNNRVFLYYISKREIENVKEFSVVKERIRAKLKHVRMEALKAKKLDELKLKFNEDTEGLKAYCEARKGER